MKGMFNEANNHLPDCELTREELAYCLEYSERRVWIRLLVNNLRAHVKSGEQRRLLGPPGLRDRMERLYTYITAHAKTLPPST